VPLCRRNFHRCPDAILPNARGFCKKNEANARSGTMAALLAAAAPLPLLQSLLQLLRRLLQLELLLPLLPPSLLLLELSSVLTFFQVFS